MAQHQRSYTYAAMIGVLLVAVALSACGRSSSGGTAAGSGASSTPYTVMTWYSYTSQIVPFPESKSAAEAAVDALNAAGGVAGRKIKLITCDDQFDPNKTVDCAREAVQDKVSAVVGASTILEPQEVYQLLQQAGIAYIGGDGDTPPEHQSTVTFSEPGAAGQFYGLVAAMAKAGDTKLAVVKCEVANCTNVAQYVVAAAKKDNVTLVRQVTAAIATTNYTAAAAEAIRGGVNGVIFVGSPPQAVPLLEALHGQGFKGAFGAPATEFPPNYLTSLASNANNIYVCYDLSAPTDASNPGVSKFMAAMKKYEPSAALTAVSLQTWWGFQLFAAIAPKAKSTSSAAILASARSLPVGSINVGIGPALPVSKTSPLAGYPGMAFDPEVAISLITNGTPGASQLVNPFSG